MRPISPKLRRLLSGGDYATAVADDAFGSIYALDLPAEELATGVAEALGL